MVRRLAFSAPQWYSRGRGGGAGECGEGSRRLGGVLLGGGQGKGRDLMQALRKP